MLLPSLKRTAAEYSERVGHSYRESNTNTKKCRVNILTDYIGRSDRWINNYNVDRGIVSRAEIMHANYQAVRYISNGWLIIIGHVQLLLVITSINPPRNMFMYISACSYRSLTREQIIDVKSGSHLNLNSLASDQLGGYFPGFVKARYIVAASECAFLFALKALAKSEACLHVPSRTEKLSGPEPSE